MSELFDPSDTYVRAQVSRRVFLERATHSVSRHR
jgi:hypothetical protein